MTSTQTTYEDRTEAAQQVYIQANEREPRDTDWGLLVTDDSVGPPASSFRFFAWFETRDQLLDFVASDLVLSAGEPPEEDEAEAVLADVAALVRKVRDGGMSREELAQAFADRLDSSQTLDWMGTFQELCTDDAAAAQEIRSEYWGVREDDHDEDSPQPPISEDEREDFVEFLRSYGA